MWTATAMEEAARGGGGGWEVVFMVHFGPNSSGAFGERVQMGLGVSRRLVSVVRRNPGEVSTDAGGWPMMPQSSCGGGRAFLR
jgi:hypothetical protein